MGEPRILTINHGECENRLVDWVKVRLNMSIAKFSRESRRKAIRIENLPDVLDMGWLSSEPALHSKYRELAYIPRQSPSMPSLSIFTIMDTEIELAHSNRAYLTGNMFNGCYFRNRITAIYNAPTWTRSSRELASGASQTRSPHRTRKYWTITKSWTSTVC